MARIRSIHPALFTDEAFASLSMSARVLLLGLWTEADDQGVFDWKPVTLKMRIMPVDNVSVPDLLLELEGWNAVKRFSQGGKELGAIRNFCKFQRPKTPKYRQINSAEIRNYVSSSYPITETSEPEPVPFPQKVEIPPQREEEGDRRKEKEVKESSPTPSAPSSSEAFQKFKAAWPKRDGANPWLPAEKKFLALVKTGVDPEIMIEAAKSLAREESARGNIGSKFVPQAITWLNQQRFQDHAAISFEDPQRVDWDAICVSYKRTGIWSKHAPGNDPESPSCQCPHEILAKHGIPLPSSSSSAAAPALRTMQ